jgi:hypothetical protein
VAFERRRRSHPFDVQDVIQRRGDAEGSQDAGPQRVLRSFAALRMTIEIDVDPLIRQLVHRHSEERRRAA